MTTITNGKKEEEIFSNFIQKHFSFPFSFFAKTSTDSNSNQTTCSPKMFSPFVHHCKSTSIGCAKLPQPSMLDPSLNWNGSSITHCSIWIITILDVIALEARLILIENRHHWYQLEVRTMALAKMVPRIRRPQFWLIMSIFDRNQINVI